MRAVFLLGGFVGFVLAAASGLQAGRSGDRVLIDAAIACLAGAFLFRWFWTRITAALVDTVRLKRLAQAAADEAQAAAKAVPVTPVKGK